MPAWLVILLILLGIIVIFPFAILFILIMQYIVISFLDMIKNKRNKK